MPQARNVSEQSVSAEGGPRGGGTSLAGLCTGRCLIGRYREGCAEEVTLIALKVGESVILLVV